MTAAGAGGAAARRTLTRDAGDRAWHAELAWLGDGGVRRDVLIEAAAGGRFHAG